MTKNFMRMLIGDDATVQDVKLALAKEKHDREQVMQGLIASGDVSIMLDMDPIKVRVRVDTEIFSDERKAYPSTQLMARVQLALHAGLSDKSASAEERLGNRMSDAMRFSQQVSRAYRSKSEMSTYTYAAADINKVTVDKIEPSDFYFDWSWYPEPEVTATVKTKRTKTRKGLRP